MNKVKRKLKFNVKVSFNENKILITIAERRSYETGKLYKTGNKKILCENVHMEFSYKLF